ncbi:hypothetical protein Psal006a_03441 (plasmid) [Piscirickettsia salmonis]|nr:hypothetical protein Psal006a_03441 [Piscirickettsia salmonis]
MVKRKRFKKNQPFKWKHYSGEIIALRHLKCNTTLY